jgi:hypothetical protein
MNAHSENFRSAWRKVGTVNEKNGMCHQGSSIRAANVEGLGNRGEYQDQRRRSATFEPLSDSGKEAIDHKLRVKMLDRSREGGTNSRPRGDNKLVESTYLVLHQRRNLRRGLIERFPLASGIEQRRYQNPMTMEYVLGMLYSTLCPYAHLIGTTL